MATPLKLLIVEDSEDDAELILLALSRAGFAPDHACVEDADALRAALDAGPWDMVICDHSLPRLDAFTALKIAREKDRDIPFIVVSGVIGEEAAVETMRVGANDYVMKENLSRLAPAIERELRDAETRRQKRETEAALEENQNRLRHAQKLEALGLLTGSVAHDFNNLLTVIMGNLDILLPKAEDDETRELIEHALQAATSGADLTQRLLSFSRNQSLNPTATDINTLIPDICELMRSAVGANIHIHRTLGDDLAEALVDRTGLENALLNLAINARDAMPGGGKLTISTEDRVVGKDCGAISLGLEPGRYVAIAVEDSGTGIDPEVLCHVFEPFFTTKRVGEGSGLGLSTVFGFAKQSGGHVEIHSELGRGTRITLYLPCPEASAEASEKAQCRPETITATTATTGGGETILVLEDNVGIQLMIHRTLTKLGYRIIKAGYGRSALELLETTPDIAMLLSDISLPGDMDGLMFVDKAIAMRPKIRFLLISGNPTKAIADTDGRYDISQVLKKPFRRGELSERVRAVLDAPAE
jgi:signal transduction histidine kinase